MEADSRGQLLQLLLHDVVVHDVAVADVGFRGLDDLEALVDHGGAVDGDLSSHGPVGMLQSILHLNILQLLSGPAAERSTGCRKQDLLDSSGRFSVQ